MRFSGVYVDKCDNGFEINQRAYIERLEPISLDADYVQLRLARAKLSWLAHSRPDICALLSKLVQVTEKSFHKTHVKTFNSTVKYLHSSKNSTLCIRKLDLDTLHIRTFSDPSFATNRGHTSQLGYIIRLCNKYDNACILHYASYKSRRVARSVLGAETYAFADANDFAYCTKKDLEAILESNVHLTMFADSKSLFDVIMKCSQTQ